ncbi:hypothetical protein [Haladaptatus sp. NG-SE-30]
MSQAVHAVTVTAEVTLLVSRGTDGDLTTAARSVLTAIDSVHTVDNVSNSGFRPRATDIEVDITAQLTVAAPTDPDTIADDLVDGFGVRSATVTAIDGV